MTTKDKVEKRIRELVPELISQTIKDWIVKEKQASYGGIEIHLEHILMAIQEKSLPKNGGVSFPEENQTDIPALWLVGKVISLYDLSKPFSDQSEEFYSFLWSILY